MRREVKTKPNDSAPGSPRHGDSGLGRPETPVAIQLSREQIRQVARAAANAGNLSLLLSVPGEHAALTVCFQRWKGSRLSDSLLRALLLLASFPADRRYLSITDLSRKCAYSPSTTHRYVSTFLAAGVLEQDPRTREYRPVSLDEESITTPDVDPKRVPR